MTVVQRLPVSDITYRWTSDRCDALEVPGALDPAGLYEVDCRGPWDGCWTVVAASTAKSVLARQRRSAVVSA